MILYEKMVQHTFSALITGAYVTNGKWILNKKISDLCNGGIPKIIKMKTVINEYYTYYKWWVYYE